MKLGLQIPSFTWPPSPTPFAARLADIARRADDAGVHSVWVMDHFFQLKGIGPPEWAMLEAYSTLSFLAGVTENVWLGTLVTGVTYRQPAVLVKTVTALDVLSQGRAYLGIGAAWNEEEHRGLGITFPSTKERFERLEETLQIARQMFAGDDTPFEGRHYQLERPLNSPLPVQRPRPPILIGGAARRRPCGWWRSMQTPAICSNSRPPRWRGSWASSAITARPLGGTMRRSRRPPLAT